MKVSRKLCIPVIALAMSVTGSAAALAATSSPGAASARVSSVRTTSVGSAAWSMRRAAAAVVAGFRMPRSTASAGQSAARSGRTKGLPQPKLVSPGAVLGGSHQDNAPANTFGRCVGEPRDGLCLWQNTGYSGDMWYYDSHGAQGQVWYFVGHPENDKASSAYNKRSNATLLGKNMPPSMPDIVCLPQQAAYGNLTAYAWPDGSSMNDSISSFNYLPNEPNC